MKPFSVNLSKFKKMAQDKKSTTLRDPDGHEIRIVHSALPAIQRKQLEGLPMYAEGTPDGTVSAEDAIPSTAQILEVNPQVPQTPTNPRTGDLIAEDRTIDPVAAVKAANQSAIENQAIGAARANAQINLQKGAQAATADQAKKDQEATNTLNHMRESTKGAMQKGLINPSDYSENLRADQKITNALGLIFGGFKQGLVGGSNPAMDFINSQIDRNIAAQKENQGTRKSVYDMYHQNFGDNVIASNMSRIHQNDMIDQKARQIDAQLGTPQSHAALQQILSDNAIKNAPLLQETSGRLGGLQVGPRVIGQSGAPQGAPAQASARVPGASGSFESQGVSQAAAPAIEQTGLGTLAKGFSSLLGGKDPSQAAEQDELDKPITYSVLKPEAQKIVNGMQYSTPADKADYEKTTEQLKHAQQAEKVLNGPNGNGTGGIHDLMQRMYKNSGSGSYLSGAGLHVRENARDAAGSVPLIGEALQGAIDLAPKDQATKQYETGKAALLTDLATGLKGILAPTDIDKIVKPNLPALGDSPKDVADKEKAMVNSILKALETNMLDKKGISVKKGQ